MRKRKTMDVRTSRRLRTFLICVLLCAILVACCLLLVDPFRRFCVMRVGYYPVNEVMEQAGYAYTGDLNTYKKTVCGKEITVVFDTATGVCFKNEYSFGIDGAYRNTNGQLFVEKAILERLLTREIVPQNHISFSLETPEVSWLDYPHLVAHAGGSVRMPHENGTYTNSLEALIQNYSLGHRVFEFDFTPTSDDNLALVHDWEQFGYLDGTVFSAQEWKDFETFGSPKTDSRYTTMLIGDLLDEMLVNEDIYVVTDGKLFDEEAKKEFEILYREAQKRDISLLNRFIPQIYRNEMYDILMDVYRFPSVIYTTYVAPLSAGEIIDFVSSHDNIHVITANYKDTRFQETQLQQIHNMGRFFFVHTVNTYSDITQGRNRGVDGFYTDILLPQDLEVYDCINKSGCP